MADLSLLFIELRINFDVVDIADACIIIARVALGLPVVLEELGIKLNLRPRLEECCRLLRSVWMEFTTPSHYTSRFMAIPTKHNKFDVIHVQCPAYFPSLN